VGDEHPLPADVGQARLEAAHLTREMHVLHRHNGVQSPLQGGDAKGILHVFGKAVLLEIHRNAGVVDGDPLLAAGGRDEPGLARQVKHAGRQLCRFHVGLWPGFHLVLQRGGPGSRRE
jgi:hypothetical protein